MITQRTELNVLNDCRLLVDLWNDMRYHMREAESCRSQIRNLCKSHGVNLRRNLSHLRGGATYAIILIASVLTVLAGPPGQVRTNATLEFTYPTNSIASVDLFKVYSTTNLSQSVSSWPLYQTVQKTNLTITGIGPGGVGTNSFSVPIDATQRFFVMTASNWWGEGNFSNVATTPALPRSDSALSLGP